MPAAQNVFIWMGHEPALAADEGIYLRITLAGSVFKLLGVAFGQFLLATDRPGSVLLSTVAGVSANALAAWMLIFGHGGLPRLGVAGSAWGQNAGVVVESAVLLFFILHGPGRRLYNVLDFKLRREQMFTLLRIGIPSGVQIVADVLAWSLFGMWVMGQFGTAAMAAQTYMMRYMVVSFMPAFGVGTAVTALVGRYIGRGEPDIAGGESAPWLHADRGLHGQLRHRLFLRPLFLHTPLRQQSRGDAYRRHHARLRRGLSVLRCPLHRLQRRTPRRRRHVRAGRRDRRPLLGNHRFRRIRHRQTLPRIRPRRPMVGRHRLWRDPRLVHVPTLRPRRLAQHPLGAIRAAASRAGFIPPKPVVANDAAG